MRLTDYQISKLLQYLLVNNNKFENTREIVYLGSLLKHEYKI